VSVRNEHNLQLKTTYFTEMPWQPYWTR